LTSAFLNPSLFSIIKLIIQVLISGDSYPKKLYIELITISYPKTLPNLSSVLTTSSRKIFYLSLKLDIIGSSNVFACTFNALPAASTKDPANPTKALTSYL
jgi:hypothetical protein